MTTDTKDDGGPGMYVILGTNSNGQATATLLYEDYKALLKGVEPKQDGWRDIATAPKDGTLVLTVVAGCEPACSRWETFPETLHHAPQSCWRYQDAECFKSMDDWMEDWVESRYEPTHWMPLIPPPSKQEVAVSSEYVPTWATDPNVAFQRGFEACREMAAHLAAMWEAAIICPTNEWTTAHVEELMNSIPPEIATYIRALTPNTDREDELPDFSSYTSDRVFEGTRPLSPEMRKAIDDTKADIKAAFEAPSPTTAKGETETLYGKDAEIAILRKAMREIIRQDTDTKPRFYKDDSARLGPCAEIARTALSQTEGA